MNKGSNIDPERVKHPKAIELAKMLEDDSPLNKELARLREEYSYLLDTNPDSNDAMRVGEAFVKVSKRVEDIEKEYNDYVKKR